MNVKSFLDVSVRRTSLNVFFSLIEAIKLLRSSFDSMQGDPESHDPVVYDNGVTYMFIQHNNVFLMTASRQNCNAASILLFLHRVVDVSRSEDWFQ